jgi:hypothetical protein
LGVNGRRGLFSPNKVVAALQPLARQPLLTSRENAAVDIV